MSRDDLSLGDTLQLLEALSAPEPSRVVPSQPALGDTITPLLSTLAGELRVNIRPTYIFYDMAMVTDEEESPSLGHIDLHPDQTIGVAWQMVQSDPLTEVHTLVIERLPVSGAWLVTLGESLKTMGTYKDSFR